MQNPLIGYTVLSLLLALTSPAVAHVQDDRTKDEKNHLTVARMLHAQTDFSWLFDPVFLEHMDVTSAENHNAQQVIALAHVAQSRGLAHRPDVVAARRAADDLVLAEAARRSLVDSVRPSDAQVAWQIATHPGRYDEFHLRHIFVAVGRIRDGKTRSEADALALAKQLRARIVGGEQFEAVARAASEDASTAAEGGTLSPLLGATMSDAFLPSIKNLAVGGISDPVRGPEGYHILMLEARRAATPASARYWVEHDILEERLPALIAEAIASEKTPNRPPHDRQGPMAGRGAK